MQGPRRSSLCRMPAVFHHIHREEAVSNKTTKIRTTDLGVEFSENSAPETTCVSSTFTFRSIGQVEHVAEVEALVGS